MLTFLKSNPQNQSQHKCTITNKIKEKQQAGIEFQIFWLLPSSVGYILQLNVGKNTVHTMILKIPGD